MAALVRLTPVRRLMGLGVRLIVPRHRVGVVGVPLRADGKVLVLRHVFHPVAPWGLPGGWLGRREEPAAAVARELQEETGLPCVVGPLLLVEREGLPPHLTMVYRVTPGQGPLKLSGEILEARWCATDALPEPYYLITARAIAAAVALDEPDS
jgi:ADP-ribose pyrophosphatase YjhB (NUDIX family)